MPYNSPDRNFGKDPQAPIYSDGAAGKYVSQLPEEPQTIRSQNKREKYRFLQPLLTDSMPPASLYEESIVEAPDGKTTYEMDLSSLGLNPDFFLGRQPGRAVPVTRRRTALAVLMDEGLLGSQLPSYDWQPKGSRLPVERNLPVKKNPSI